MQDVPQHGFSRRGVLGSIALAGLAAPSAMAATASSRSAPKDFELLLRPTRVFKTADRSHERSESWIFSLAVQSTSPEPLTPASMKIDLLKGTELLRSTNYRSAGFQPLTYHWPFPPKLADGSDPPSPVFWPFLVRLRGTEPIALGVDAMRVAIEAADASGHIRTSSITVPIETYAQKTALIFPFRGKGIILQGGATNGGHRNRSGAFAMDACGLDDAWSVCAPGDGKKNSDYPGFGRPLMAPADGTVVSARGDRPDQPVADESNPDYFLPEFQKMGGGDPGNHLIVDHGNNEFSMIAHFMAGSMLVKNGDHVKQGQMLGKLGHSGDTDTPHVHYQLQAGPDWMNADALPCKFTNVDQQFLDRGTYFTAT